MSENNPNISQNFRISHWPLAVGGVVVLLGVLLQYLNIPWVEIWSSFVLELGVAFVIAAIVGFAVERNVKEIEIRRARELRVDALEERVQANPEKPQLLWDLARATLEKYLDRNVRQVSSIYNLTLFVMSAGIILVFIGVWQSIVNPLSTTPSVISALAGIIIQIIGGTFLLIFRSTMDQARTTLMF